MKKANKSFDHPTVEQKNINQQIYNSLNKLKLWLVLIVFFVFTSISCDVADGEAVLGTSVNEITSNDNTEIDPDGELDPDIEKPNPNPKTKNKKSTFGCSSSNSNNFGCSDSASPCPPCHSCSDSTDTKGA